ncbi:hypothetical protein GCM10026987_04740 [Belliella aquatica]|uniref:Uncharacterized protein n=1 Tax=Belliella aquatica TaxID=1323734 RepID=A0ABQ1MBG5_9BACT|nr:hypothetical protein GCM10010993_15680 [Belliella aquatica]
MCYLAQKFKEKRLIIYIMLLQIFNSPIAPGAQLFLLIVCILIGLGAGLSAIDARSTLFKKKSDDKH